MSRTPQNSSSPHGHSSRAEIGNVASALNPGHLDHGDVASLLDDSEAVNQRFLALVDQLSLLATAVDVDGIDVTSQAYLLSDVLDLQTRLEAFTTKLAGRVDTSMVWSSDGSRSAAAWLERESGRNRQECKRLFKRARHLRNMPLTERQFGEGKLSAAHVDALAQKANKLPELFPEAEELLVSHANMLTFGEFRALLDHWEVCADPDQAEITAAKQFENRSLHLSPGLDGVGWLDIQFEPFGHEIFSNALSRIQQELWKADWAEARAQYGEATTSAHMARTDAQRRYDALVEMAKRSMLVSEKTRPIPPLITVHVDHETVTGRVCELGSGAQITPGQITRLLADAEVRIERAVFNSKGEVIDLGRSQRLFIGSARHALEISDRHCQYPGCRVPAEFCEADHIKEWEHGGETNQNNGQLLCPAHHRNKAKHPPKQQKVGFGLWPPQRSPQIEARIAELLKLGEQKWGPIVSPGASDDPLRT